MDGLDDIVLKLMKTLVNVDFAILHLKTQNTYGPLVGHLMGLDMQYARYVKRMTAWYPFPNPLYGQSRNSYGFFVTQKWLSCWQAQGHNKDHCNLSPEVVTILLLVPTGQIK